MVTFGLTVLAICCLFLVFSINSNARNLSNLHKERFLTVKNLWTVAISNTIEAEEFLLETIALQANLTDKTYSIEERVETLQANLKAGETRGFLDFGIIQLDGTLYLTDGTVVDVFTEDYFTIPIEGENFISDPFISTFKSHSGDLIQISAVPLPANDKPTEVLILIKNGYTLTELLIELEENIAEFGLIISLETGEFVAHIDPSRVTASIIEEAKTDPSLENFANIIASTMKEETGNRIFLYYDGRPKFATYQSIPETNWGLVVYNDITTIEMAHGTNFRTMILLSIIICFVTFIIAFIISKNITRSIPPLTS